MHKLNKLNCALQEVTRQNRMNVIVIDPSVELWELCLTWISRRRWFWRSKQFVQSLSRAMVAVAEEEALSYDVSHADLNRDDLPYKLNGEGRAGGREGAR